MHPRCPHAHSNRSRRTLSLRDRKEARAVALQLTNRINRSRCAGPFHLIGRQSLEFELRDRALDRKKAALRANLDEDAQAEADLLRSLIAGDGF
jgi:hypothetical protein